MSFAPVPSTKSSLFHGLCLALTALCPASLRAQAPTDAHYNSLTNNVRTFTNFNPEVVRGFVVVGDDVYSVNSYESTIAFHSGLSSAGGVVAPRERWRTLNNPVSIAHFGGELYVVGQGNHALARHSKTDGKMLEVLTLPSEPADIVIDEENASAWVSCMGADSVVRVSLAGPMTILNRWSWAQGLKLKRPRFLWLDLGGPGAADNTVCVAPLISGNNTLITNRDMAGTSATGDTVEPVVRDGNNLSVFPGGGLPDQDLFRIDPNQSPALQVRPLVKGAGSLILAHGRNPVTGEYWLLNVQHDNVSTALPLNEPGQRGQFAANRLTRVVLSPSAIVQPSPASIVDLDDFLPATAQPDYARNRSVSFPYALDFEAVSGRCAIAGATSPIVVLTNSAGQRTSELKISLRPSAPQGAAGLVPRTVRFVGQTLLVYCQQTSNLQVWNVAGATPGWVATLSLGNDPTPDAIKKGRAIFYDGVPSMNGRTSCNTCHPGGGADGLVWQIENAPVDHKPPMVTQPLFGIEDTFPYHWRGERTLADFNAAFPGLLGHDAALDTTPDGKLDQLLEFLFSLTPPANPLQDLDRKLRHNSGLDELYLDLPMPDDGPYSGDPVNGNIQFRDPLRRTDANGNCVLCHMDPTGSNGDFNVELQSSIATRSVMKVAHLDNQLALKNQPRVFVAWTGTPASFPSNLLGSGTAHSGQILNIPEFVDHFFGSQTFLTQKFSKQESADVAAFLMLFDTGMAPAVHHAVRLNPSSTAAALTEVQTMIDQALPRSGADPRGGGAGLIVVGQVPLGSSTVNMTWRFDPLATPPVFVPANAQPFGPGGPTLTPQPLTFFQNQPTADNFFLGAPPGNERRLGTDFDDDGLDLLGEQLAGTDPWNPDSDGDGSRDGAEVDNGSSPTNANSTPANASNPALITDANSANSDLDFVNASQVKLHFRATEPVRWKIELGGFSTHYEENGPLVLQLQTTTPLPVVSSSRLSFDTQHTALVHGLVPSTFRGNILTTINTYSGTIELTDAQGSVRTYPLVFRTGNSSASSFFDTANNLPLAAAGKRPLVIGELVWETQNRTANEFEGTVRVVVEKRIDAPDQPASNGGLVVAQLLKQVGDKWEIILPMNILMPLNPPQHSGPATNFSHLTFQAPLGAVYTALPGPFLVLPATNPNGETWSEFRVDGLNPGQKVKFNILAIEPPATGSTPQAPVLNGELLRYQMPATPAPLRGLDSTL